MAFLYNIGIQAYHLAIQLAAPFNEKAALLRKGRKEVWKKAAGIQRGEGRLVWFHAASLGEFEQGRPVIEALKAAEPATQILLTFFRPQVMKSAKIIPVQITSFICREIRDAMRSA